MSVFDASCPYPWPLWMAARRHRRRGPPGPPAPPDLPEPPGPPGPPPWARQMFGGGPPRAERGEVRFLILDALADQPRHGYEVIQTIESRSEGAYRPSPGTVYPTLQMLEELGQVRSKEVEGRKTYEITDEGRAELEAHRDEVEEAYERLSGGPFAMHPEEVHQLWERVHRITRSVGSGLRRGRLGATKLRAIRKVIAEAADRIDEILRG